MPDLGGRLHNAISEKTPDSLDFNCARATIRIHALLLLREQVALIREARACFAAGRPVESRDSVVLPGLHWERVLDAGKGTLVLRLVGVPEWILKNEVTADEFWVMPLDGTVPWQFRAPDKTIGRR